MHSKLEAIREKVNAETNLRGAIELFARSLAREFRQAKKDSREIQAMADDLERETPQFVHAIAANTVMAQAVAAEKAPPEKAQGA
jgi:hypothetical protein